MSRLLQTMKHSPITNYGGIPGLTSWLIGGMNEHGIVRLMECSRNHHEPIIPHSHRFDFECLVLAGEVRNVIWTRNVLADHFQESTLIYGGEPGLYSRLAGDVNGWYFESQTYSAGERYSMTANQIHSIYFTRNTSVLFFEGPQVTEESMILEPNIGGVTVPTFKVEPWAFKREPA